LSVFAFLVHAHDYVWADRRVGLKDRMAACDLLWRAAIRAAREGSKP
jgi:hypothetical protein